MSLRFRVAVATALTTLIVVGLAGAAFVHLAANDQRAALDRQLRTSTDLAGRQFADERIGQSLQALPRVSKLLQRQTQTLSSPDLQLTGRLVVDGTPTTSIGEFPLATDDVLPTGFSNREIDGVTWRFLSTPATTLFPDLAKAGPRLRSADLSRSAVEVGTPATSVEETIRQLRRRAGMLSLLALVLAALLGWLLGDAALRPLARLRRDAERVSGTDDLGVRVADGQGLREVDDLGRSVNHMLERIEQATRETEAALEASRAFAGNAAHELRTPLTSIQANLDVLERNPGLTTEQRAEIISDVQEQQGRLVRLLGALRLLARGDLHTAPLTARIDLVELTDTATAGARQRHPDTTIELQVEGGPHSLDGWEEGLRVMLDNLLDNAALHGRRDGDGATVRVTLATDATTIGITVDDNGPGIPPEDRQRVLERFGRGRNASPGGSGLGLALVAQQAALHHGSVNVGDSPSGGARVTVLLPRTGAEIRDPATATAG